jgi:hypothetical protein
MNPLQQADNLFASIVGASVEQLLMFATTNENIDAVRLLTTQYLSQIKLALVIPA